MRLVIPRGVIYHRVRDDLRSLAKALVGALDEPAPIAAFEDTSRGLAGVQWHPEVLHTQAGQKVLENFLFKGARLDPNWTTRNILEEQVERIRVQVGSSTKRMNVCTRCIKAGKVQKPSFRTTASSS